jgi:hypothetical protein
MGSGIKQVYGEGLSAVYTAAQATDDKSYIQSWVGQERFDEKGNKYRFVLNVSTVLTVGEPVCYDVSDTTFDEIGNVVATPVTADLGSFAGICVGAIPASGYGYIQTHGYNAAIDLDTATSVTAGQSAYAINGAAGVDPVTTGGVAPVQQAFVKIAVAGTTVTTVEGYIYGTL